MAPRGWKQHGAEGLASIPLPFVMSQDKVPEICAWENIFKRNAAEDVRMRED